MSKLNHQLITTITNVHHLRSLDEKGMSRLLKEMNLTEHIETFRNNWMKIQYEELSKKDRIINTLQVEIAT